MPAPLINFPLSSIVDGILSYLQWIFGNTEIVPSEYRWNADDRKSLIRISGPFVIDNQKPMSAPFIVAERGSFTFANQTVDNTRGADANTFENMSYTDWGNGYVNLICGSSVAGEASSLANFVAIMMQADRKEISDKLQFLRNLYYLDVSPEIPVYKATEVKRWEVTVRFFVSLQMNWFKSLKSPQLWTKAAFYGTDPNKTTFSEAGSTTEGSDTLVDTTKDFGPYITNNPQLLEQELAKKYYYIRFAGSDYPEQLYTVTQIVNNHTLQLLTHDTENLPIAWSAPATATGLHYDLLWNNIHVYMELPKPPA